MQHEENACAAGASVFESKPLLTVTSGFFLYRSWNRALSQLFEPCLSCGRRLRLTAAAVTVRGICGHVAVCKVCASCVIERGLIG